MTFIWVIFGGITQGKGLSKYERAYPQGRLSWAAQRSASKYWHNILKKRRAERESTRGELCLAHGRFSARDPVHHWRFDALLVNSRNQHEGSDWADPTGGHIWQHHWTIVQSQEDWTRRWAGVIGNEWLKCMGRQFWRNSCPFLSLILWLSWIHKTSLKTRIKALVQINLSLPSSKSTFSQYN